MRVKYYNACWEARILVRSMTRFLSVGLGGLWLNYHPTASMGHATGDGTLGMVGPLV